MKARFFAYAVLLWLAACGPTPVYGSWESLGIATGGSSIDVTYDFSDRTVSTKTVTNQGGSATITTSLSGTYSWENKNDGTHVLAVYSSMTLTDSAGNSTSPLNTVCVEPGKNNCEGFSFKLNDSTTGDCLCKRQELVFKVEGDTMSTTYGDTPAVFRRPQARPK